jgi:hypothetical protein
MMHDAESTEPENMAQDWEVEFTDLDLPDDAGRSQSLLSAFTLLHGQRSLKRVRSRRYWPWVSTVSIFLMLVVLFRVSNGLSSELVNSFTSAFLPASPASPSGAARPGQESITCLKDAAWSPDSTLIAVLGYPQHCSEDDYPPELLNLYDAHAHTLLAQWHPAAAIVHALTSSASVPHRQPPVIHFMHVMWSPDGHRIACTFTTPSVQPPVNGVVLMERDGGHPQVLLQPQSATDSFYAEWDLARSRSVHSSTQSLSSLMPLSPALAYHWSSNGTLVPETLLTPTGVPAGPQPGAIGNPDGDPSFTIWQPGAVSVTAMADSSRLFFWSASFAAWSPDGRYLVDGIAPLGCSGHQQDDFFQVLKCSLLQRRSISRCCRSVIARSCRRLRKRQRWLGVRMGVNWRCSLPSRALTSMMVPMVVSSPHLCWRARIWPS